MREYLSQVLVDSVVQPIVLRLRNPSPQAHFGAIYGEDGWIERYEDKDVGALLLEATANHPNTKHFELIVSGDDWRIRPF